MHPPGRVPSGPPRRRSARQAWAIVGGVGRDRPSRRDEPLSVPIAAAVETLKVSTRSNPNSVAGAIAGAVRTSGAVLVQVVGAGALNQATKASVIARGILSDEGLDIVVVPSFADIEIDGEARTALRLRLEDRQHRTQAPDPLDRPVDGLADDRRPGPSAEADRGAGEGAP